MLNETTVSDYCSTYQDCNGATIGMIIYDPFDGRFRASLSNVAGPRYFRAKTDAILYLQGFTQKAA
jgi:hypothetical protein